MIPTDANCQSCGKGIHPSLGVPLSEALSEAGNYWLRSLDWARRQESLLWELRAAISFAELRRGQGRIVEARDLLMPVYQRFTEGFGSADLRAAESLLKALS